MGNGVLYHLQLGSLFSSLSCYTEENTNYRNGWWLNPHINDQLVGNRFHVLGLYSLSGKTSYRQISLSLEATRLNVIIVVSLWNLTGTSAAALSMCLLNFRAIGKVQTRISRLRDFTRSCSKTSYHLVNRGPDVIIWNWRWRNPSTWLPQWALTVCTLAIIQFTIHFRVWNLLNLDSNFTTHLILKLQFSYSISAKETTKHTVDWYVDFIGRLAFKSCISRIRMEIPVTYIIVTLRAHAILVMFR